MISLSNSDLLGLEKLLEDKSLTVDQRRRLLATAIALKLIAAVTTAHASSYKLADEMRNLSSYVDAIETSLLGRKG